MNTDDIKIFAKNEKVFESQIQTIGICTQDIAMEFGIEECALLLMRTGKRQIMKWIELPNQVRIRSLTEKETYKY